MMIGFFASGVTVRDGSTIKFRAPANGNTVP